MQAWAVSSKTIVLYIYLFIPLFFSFIMFFLLDDEEYS